MPHKPSAHLQQLFDALLRSIKAQASPLQAPREGNEVGCFSYGLSMPVLRAIFRQLKPDFRKLSLSESLTLAELFFEASAYEVRNMAIFLLALRVSEFELTHLEQIDRFCAACTSWGLVDDFAINVLQPLLRKYPQQVLQLVEGWTRSPIRWKRRASMVIFTRNIGASGEFSQETLRLCEALLWDQDDLVQKAVGWALKDTMRGAKERVLPYIKNLRRRGISSTITLYAIRDLKGAERQEILGIHPL